MLVDLHLDFNRGGGALGDDVDLGNVADAYAFQRDRRTDLEAGGILKVRTHDEVARPEAARIAGHEEDERDESAKSDDHQNAHFQL